MKTLPQIELKPYSEGDLPFLRRKNAATALNSLLQRSTFEVQVKNGNIAALGLQQATDSGFV